MALTVQIPNAGTLPISVCVTGSTMGGVVVATPLPSGVTIVTPPDGELRVLGAAVVAHVSSGAIVAGFP